MHWTTPVACLPINVRSMKTDTSNDKSDQQKTLSCVSATLITFKMLAEFRQNAIPHIRQGSMYYWSERLQCIQYMNATVVTRQRMTGYHLHINYTNAYHCADFWKWSVVKQALSTQILDHSESQFKSICFQKNGHSSTWQCIYLN